VVALTANNSPTSVVKPFTEELAFFHAQRTHTHSITREYLPILCGKTTLTPHSVPPMLSGEQAPNNTTHGERRCHEK
jgi:hypothetical protein